MDKALENQIKIFMAQALAEGKSLSDIQNEVNSNFGTNLTYMDVRILASTLEVDWKALDPNKKTETPEPENDAAAAADTQDTETENNVSGENSAPADMNSGTTVVELNTIARPGMMFSGTVTFANGSAADWYVDSTGRLGVENLNGEKPSQQDIEAFQIELDKTLRKAMGR